MYQQFIVFLKINLRQHFMRQSHRALMYTASAVWCSTRDRILAPSSKNRPYPFPTFPGLVAKRRLNQVSSVLCLVSCILFLLTILCFSLESPFVFGYFVLSVFRQLVVLVWLSVRVQVTDWKDSFEKMTNNLWT